MPKVTLEKVVPGNLSDCGIGCLTNPKNQGDQPNLVWNERLLSDHYVSKGRFKNIMWANRLAAREER